MSMAYLAGLQLPNCTDDQKDTDGRQNKSNHTNQGIQLHPAGEPRAQ